MITQQELKQRLRYDPLTGIWTWIDCINKSHNGRNISVNTKSYKQIVINYNTYQLHNLVWLYMTGKFPRNGYEIDHKDGNPSNNKFDNLREATRSQNNWNSKLAKNNTSGYKGLTLNKQTGKWRARIRCYGKKINLGTFNDKLDAINALKEARIKYHGDFARIN